MTEPLSRCISPRMAFSNDDLPVATGPTTATSAPGPTLSETLRRTTAWSHLGRYFCYLTAPAYPTTMRFAYRKLQDSRTTAPIGKRGSSWVTYGHISARERNTEILCTTLGQYEGDGIAIVQLVALTDSARPYRQLRFGSPSATG